MPVSHFRPKTPAERGRARRQHAMEPFRGPSFALWPAEQAAAIAFLSDLESPATAATYSGALVGWFRFCRAAGLAPFGASRTDAKRWFAESADRAPMTRSNLCVAVRSFYNHVLDEDDPPIDHNPFHRVGPKKPRPRRTTPALEQATFDELLAHLARRAAAPPARLIKNRDLAMIYLMGRIGPRAMTTAHLRWGDVESSGERVWVRLHLKGDRYETIELPDDVVAILAGWYNALTTAVGRTLRPDDALFPPIGVHATKLRPGRIEPMGQDGVSYVVKRRLREIGVVGDRWAAHAMRATAATIAHENGASIEECQAMLCHLNRSQTEGYIKRRSTRSAARHWTPNLGELGVSMPWARLPAPGSVLALLGQPDILDP